jgi:protein-arginine kinase activator protein McsA
MGFDFAFASLLVFLAICVYTFAYLNNCHKNTITLSRTYKMACGACGKRKSNAQKPSIVRSGNVNRKAVSKLAKSIARPGTKAAVVESTTNLRCPVCRAALKKISRVGTGEALKCMNPKCSFVRKSR